MTLKLTIKHPELDSAYVAVVVDTYDHVSTVIRPGGSADFWVHSAKQLVIHERLIPKNEEPESSPS